MAINIRIEADGLVVLISMNDKEVQELLTAIADNHPSVSMAWIEKNVSIIVHETDRCNGEGHKTELDWV